MMLKPLFFLLALIALLSVEIKAQDSICQIEGQVRDERGEALPMVPVVLAIVDERGQEKMVAYAYTDEEGHYCLSVSFEKEAVQWVLTASLLGFEKQSVILALPANKGKVKQDFVLQPASFTMKQVVVVDSLSPLQEPSDTIEYEAADYSDSTEYYVGELLKKMPGIEIDDSGRITVNGKSVKKILVEGDDFFGGNYGLLTENMQANLVDRVQIIDHYQENPVFEGVVVSTELVLNLVLKEDVKGKPSGQIRMGAGYGDSPKWSVGANVFAFSKKSRGILLLNGDNVSSDFWQEASGSLSQMEGASHVSLPSREVMSILSFSDLANMGLSPRFSLRRQSGLGAFAQIFNLKPGWKLQVSTIGQLSKDEQSSVSSTSFFLSDSLLFFMTDEKQLEQTGRKWGSLVLLKHQAADHKKSLLVAMEAGGHGRSEMADFSRIFNRDTFLWPASMTSDPIHYAFTTEYTQKMASHLVWQATFRASGESGEEVLRSESTIYPVFFDRDSSFSTLSQQSRYSQSLYSGFLRLLGGYGSHGFSLQAGGNVRTIRLNSGLSLGKGNNLIKLEAEPYQTDFLLEQKSLDLRGTAYLIANDWLFRLGLDAVYFHNVRRKQQAGDAAFCLPSYSIEGRSLGYSKARFSFRYSYGTSLPRATELNTSSLFITPYLLQQGRSAWDIRIGHLLSFLFRYRDDSYNRGAYWKLQASRKKTRSFSTLLSPFLLEGGMYFPAKETYLISSVRGEQLIPSWNILLKLGVRGEYREGENRLNDLPRQWKSRSLGVYFFWGTAFDFPVNLHWENRLNKTQTVVVSSGAPFRQTSISWLSYLKVSLFSECKLFGKLDFYSLATYFEGERTALLFVANASATLRFNLHDRPSFLSLQLSNLSNTSSLDSFFFTDWIEQSFSIQAVPRFFLLKWDLSF